MVHEHLMPASYIAHNSDHWSCYAFMSYTTSRKQCNIRITVYSLKYLLSYHNLSSSDQIMNNHREFIYFNS